MKTIRQLIQSTLSRFGYQIVYFGKGNVCPPHPLEAFFTAIREAGFAPKHIIDVGANRGTWTRAALKHFPNTRFTLIEPQERFRPRIQDLIDGGRQVEWITAGAGDQVGRLTFHVPHCDTSASFLDIPPTEGTDSVDAFEVDVLTLDEVVRRTQSPIPDLVKIDAEGLDLKVLAGAKTLLGKTDIFMLEAALFDDKVENTLIRTINLMAEHGYVPLDITDLNRCKKTGFLWLTEMVFIRSDSALRRAIPPYVASFQPY